MLSYETLILSHTQITKDELSMMEDYFDKLLSGVKGKVISFDKWGKYRLAYPVKKNDYGIYILIRYEIPKNESGDIFKNIDSFFKIKCHEIILRFVTTKLNKKITAEYKYPEPVDARVGNVDSFLKENKMESFLNSSYSAENKKIAEEKSVDKQTDSNVTKENEKEDKKELSEENN